MHRVKQLLAGKLGLRNYDAQVGAIYAMFKELNKLMELGMPEILCHLKVKHYELICLFSDLNNKTT